MGILPTVVGGVVLFAVFFCANHFLGIIKDKEGNKSLKWSFLATLGEVLAVILVWWLVGHFLF